MPKVRLGATRSRRKPPPEGWELIEPTLEELEGKMREAETESHEGKRKVIHRDSCTFTRGILDLNRPEGLSGCSWDADRTNPISRENIAQDDHSDDDGIGCKGEPCPNLPPPPPYRPSIQGCRSVEEFQILNRVEEGAYGVVYRARDKKTRETVALKRLKMEDEEEGFPINSLREINTLLVSQHPNVVKLREVVLGSSVDKTFIVMDFVEHDLKSHMERMRRKGQVFLPGQIKCLMVQLLTAVAHLHDNWILLPTCSWTTAAY